MWLQNIRQVIAMVFYSSVVAMNATFPWNAGNKETRQRSCKSEFRWMQNKIESINTKQIEESGWRRVESWSCLVLKVSVEATLYWLGWGIRSTDLERKTGETISTQKPRKVQVRVPLWLKLCNGESKWVQGCQLVDAVRERTMLHRTSHLFDWICCVGNSSNH